MSIATVANFADALRRYHLLEPAQLDELTRDLQARFPEPKALARELLRRGWLTPFQINQLFLDKGADLLLGSYVVLERLGEGGMGTVFKARNWKLGQTVALKVIHKNRLAHGGAVERFQREIRAAAKLNHPHIVRAFDADVAGDRHFFVMEHIEGADLGKLLKERGPLPIAEACEYMRQAALGLQHACDRGLVHRDIKPNNLLVARTRKDSGTSAQAPVLKILDMGLARLDQGRDNDEDATSTLTQEGAVMGTVDYMAPEQALDSHRVDIRADLYSLGCTFYYLLAGRVPFPGGEALQKLLRHREQEATPIEQLRPDVPERLSAIIRQLMAKRPEDRWQSPAELAAALEVCLRETPKEQAAGAPPRLAGLAASGEPFAHLLSQDTDIGATSFPRAESKRPWLLVVVVGVGVLLGMAGLVLLLYLLREKPRPSEPLKPVEVVPPNPLPPVPAHEPLLPRLTIQAQQNVISHLAFAPDGRQLVSGSRDRSVRAWDPVSGTAHWATLNKLHEVSALAYSADGRRLAAGQVWTQSATLLDPETGKPLTGAAHPARTGPIALAANGKTLAVGGGDDGTILVVDIDSGDKRFLKHDKQVTGLAFAPAGPWLASLGWFGLKLWHLGEDVPLSSIKPGSMRAPVAFTADGNQVVYSRGSSAGQRSLVFLNVPGLTEGRVVPLADSTSHDPLAYAPDLRTVAAARKDGMITLWDAATGEKRATLKGSGTTVRVICYSWDSKTLAAGGEDGCIYIWDVPSPPAGASGQ